MGTSLDEGKVPATVAIMFSPQARVPRDQGPAVFSQKAADYRMARPAYPAVWFESLVTEGLLFPDALVADIGAGTGLLTASLLDRGVKVIAVEPNDEMRAACEAWLGGRANFRVVAGTAAATTLEENSVDLVTAAQAFHWFDVDESRREFLRILKPGGQVALVWNDRDDDDPLQQMLTTILAETGGTAQTAVSARENKAGVPEFFGGSYRTFEFRHEQRLTREGLRGLMFSRSYMPSRDSPVGARVCAETDLAFDAYANGDTVAIHYRTVTMLGRPAEA